MYKITFDNQPRHDIPDEEYNSIVVTDESYKKLPKLSLTNFDDACKFSKGEFCDQIRHEPEHRYPALWISNPGWKLEKSPGQSMDYIDDTIYWVFVCLNVKANMWIAFQYYDAASWDDAYGSTVGVSYPRHGPVYRLTKEHMKIVRKFFP